MAKKKKKRGTRPEGYDPNEARRQRLEARRVARAAELAAAARRERRARLVRILVYAGVLTALIWFFFLRETTPEEIDGHRIELAGDTTAGVHRPPYTYDSVPPVAGPHVPAGEIRYACGVNPAQIPDEQQVHLLEHGAVGIQYQPTLDLPDIRTIEEIVGRYDSHVFSAPYDTLETPIAVSSWGEYMPLESLDEDAIVKYIEEFREGGPEEVDCPNDADQPFEPPVTPTPGATPPAPPEPTSTADETPAG